MFTLHQSSDDPSSSLLSCSFLWKVVSVEQVLELPPLPQILHESNSKMPQKLLNAVMTLRTMLEKTLTYEEELLLRCEERLLRQR